MIERYRLTAPVTRSHSRPRVVSRLLVSIVLFGLALLPRLPDLGRFLTADEFLWVDRSRNFLAGLTNPAYTCTTPVETWAAAQGLACTLRTGHPGVTTMWTGSFGLLLRWLQDGRPAPLFDYVTAVETNPLDVSFVAPERLGTVLLAALWVVAVYWLARRLFGPAIALLGAVFIALDPFHIALSRVIHHDALSTIFMTLSVFCMLIYWAESERRRRWLLASGLLAGFGFLSKSPAMYLMPFVALAGLWFFTEEWRRRASGSFAFAPNLIRLLADGLLWFAAALAVVFVFWPAMWVVPLETVQTVFFVGSKYATGGHAKGNFFLGVISQDPGPLFYPVTWLYRAGPLALPGLIAGLVAWALALRKGPPASRMTENKELLSPASFSRYLPLILLFILGYTLLMTLGEKKQDRYLLPVYPWLNLMAAAGWVAAGRWLDGRLATDPNAGGRSRSWSGFVFSVFLGLVLLVNGGLVAAHFPYYFTYYNPLLGGIKGAARAITIGWGEGLDLAAAYLNQKPDPAGLRVASWYESTFAPYFHGRSISYSKEKGKVLAGDYAIFYINQTQRRYPDDALFEYFEARFEPEKIIRLHGLDYAWIYPSLGVDHYIQDQAYTGIAGLLAWQWQAGDRALVPGRPAGFELYWEYLGKRADEPFFLRLVDDHDRMWAEALSQPVAAENPPPGQWQEGEIITERGVLELSPDTPPGRYRLQLGFYTHAPAVKSGELLFDVPEAEALVIVSSAPAAGSYRLPATASPIGQPLGDRLTLLGAAWPGDPISLEQAGQPEAAAVFPLDLYWRVEQPLSAGVAVHAGLMDETGVARHAWFDLSLAEVIDAETTTWQPGDIIHTRWQLDLPLETPAGVYSINLVLPDDTSQTLPFGRLEIEK